MLKISLNLCSFICYSRFLLFLTYLIILVTSVPLTLFFIIVDGIWIDWFRFKNFSPHFRSSSLAEVLSSSFTTPRRFFLLRHSSTHGKQVAMCSSHPRLTFVNELFFSFSSFSRFERRKKKFLRKSKKKKLIYILYGYLTQKAGLVTWFSRTDPSLLYLTQS